VGEAVRGREEGDNKANTEGHYRKNGFLLSTAFSIQVSKHFALKYRWDYGTEYAWAFALIAITKCRQLPSFQLPSYQLLADESLKTGCLQRATCNVQLQLQQHLHLHLHKLCSQSHFASCHLLA